MLKREATGTKRQLIKGNHEQEMHFNSNIPKANLINLD